MNIKYAEWKKCRVAPDYHVEIADHYFSDLAPWSIRTPLLSHRLSRIKLHLYVRVWKAFRGPLPARC